MGILNNLIVADTLWLHHIVQRPAQVASLNGIRLLPKPEALDQVLVTELANWHARRTMLNQAIESLMKQINSADLESILFYASTEVMGANMHLKNIFLQFFSYKIHHRGQISTLLFLAGVDVGLTDLLSMVPNVVDN